ncbi:MAG: NAD-binding protein [Burkholderiales bacterium]|nr:NAD-binding protein [Burkholderiales bacterium]
MTMTVGIVGVGAMGGPIAGHIAKAGHRVVGYDPDPLRQVVLTELGGKLAASAGAAVAQADVSLLLLPTPKVMDDVVQEIAAHARAGALVLECGTFPIADKERARAALAARGIVLLDCPLSGTAAQAAVKNLALFGSGERGDYERALPVIEAFTERADYVGPFGNGMRMKLVANTLVATHTAAAAEALALAQRLGLDLATTHRVMSASPAATSAMLKHRGALMVARRYEPAGGALAILTKDARIIAEAAAQVGADMPLFAAAAARYNAAYAKGRPQQDAAVIFEEFVAGTKDA